MEIEVQDPTTGETHKTNPARDVAFFMPYIADKVRERLEWVKLSEADRKLLADAGVTAIVLMETFGKFTLFFKNAIDPDLKTPQDAIEATGFLAMPAAAQTVVLCTFSRAAMGAFWGGIRSAVMIGECPPMIATLVRKAEAYMDSYVAKSKMSWLSRILSWLHIR